MSAKQNFTTEQAHEIGNKLGIGGAVSTLSNSAWVWMLSWSMVCVTRQRT